MYNFLLIEDTQSDAKAFEDTVKRINADEAIVEKYHLDIAKTFEEGKSKINSSVNGIIVDIKLDDGNDGNDIIKLVTEKFRVPVAIFTGTPDTPQEPDSPIHVYKKGEASHEEILNDLSAVLDTGLYNVLGGTGVIERAMNRVFWEFLYPKIDIWKTKKQEGIDTEKVLLRYAISHIHELIDNERPKYITEEMYICPPVNQHISTGSIVRNKADSTYGIVLSPPCDLEIREDGTFKTDSILICKIEPQDQIHSPLLRDKISDKSRRKEIKKAAGNNYTEYYHWLPHNALFDGGYINFRKVSSYSPAEFGELFDLPTIKIQENFVKSILSRFSSYYARQGQPEFDCEKEIAIAAAMHVSV